MEKVLEKSKCMGCTACMNICPVNAIKMECDEEGFKYPIIDQEKCINCGACKKTCPVLNTTSNDSINDCYVCYSKDPEILENSSSGGVFTTIANSILENNGIVIGASLTKDNKLKHIAITKENDLKLLQGSKYLQSDLENIFKFIKENIKEKVILFVGTPCQIGGLKAFLRHNTDNLITLDVICHGVPSPKLFDYYIKELEKKENQKVINYNFRSKKTGWDTYSNTVTFQNKEKSQYANENPYMKLFLSDVALRESCYNCNFKLGNKYSDITLGDFWGIKNVNPKMYNKSGVSAIVVNTKKGSEILKSIENNLIIEKTNLEDIVTYNKSLKFSSKRPSKRKQFFVDLENKSINNLVKIYCNQKLSQKFILKTKNIIKKIIK